MPVDERDVKDIDSLRIDTHATAVSHELHRNRRKPLASFFTRPNLESVELIIAHKAKNLANRLQSLSGSGAVVQIEHAFAAYAGDIICMICCDHPSEMLDDPNFAPYW